jgi:hypothetical protein
MMLLLSLLNAYRNEPGLRDEAKQLINAGFDTKSDFDGRPGVISDDTVLMFGAVKLGDVTVLLAVTGYVAGGVKSWQCTGFFGPSTDSYGFPPGTGRTDDEKSAHDAVETCLTPLMAWAIHRQEFKELRDEYGCKAARLMDRCKLNGYDWLHGAYVTLDSVENPS